PRTHMTPSIAAQRSPRFVSKAARPVLCALALAAVAACSSTKSSVATDPASDMGTAEMVWLEPTPGLARDIEFRALEVSQMATTDDFVRHSDWFQTVGEPAYTKLLEMVLSPDQKQQAFALSVIAAQRDVRMLQPLRETAPLDSIENEQRRFEMARALLMLGDNSGIPVLLDGLESSSPGIRRLCIAALKRGTNQDLSYHGGDSEEVRAQSVAAWRQWWSEMNQDTLLSR
ncbi:MAG: hypothetical protein ACI80K_004675, partial [Paracoccaceae bacterium]